MKTLPIRLTPGQDLRTALEAAVQSQNCRAAFVLSGIGSLSTAGLRFAGAEQPERLTGDLEILSLSWGKLIKIWSNLIFLFREMRKYPSQATSHVQNRQPPAVT